MAAPQSAAPIVPLDLLTLTAVKQEVERRQQNWRAAWRLNGPGPFASGFDPRIERAAELGALLIWLDERLEEADAELTRWALTEGGIAALLDWEEGQ